MIERLLELKDFCVNFATTEKKVDIAESEWTSLAKLKETLESAKEATKFLQYEQLIAGNFLSLCNMST
jgi:hypothetical protein